MPHRDRAKETTFEMAFDTSRLISALIAVARAAKERLFNFVAGRDGDGSGALA
jgi:hypothetical protein